MFRNLRKVIIYLFWEEHDYSTSIRYTLSAFSLMVTFIIVYGLVDRRQEKPSSAPSARHEIEKQAQERIDIQSPLPSQTPTVDGTTPPDGSSELSARGQGQKI